MRLLFAVILFAGPALAADPSPMEQTLGTKLMQELNLSLTCSASLIVMQQQLTSTQGRVKELEAKYEQKEEK